MDLGVRIGIESILALIFMLILTYLFFKAVREKKIFISLVCVLLIVLFIHSSYHRYQTLISLSIFEADQVEITSLNEDEIIEVDAGVLLEGITGHISYGKINKDFSLDYKIDFQKEGKVLVTAYVKTITKDEVVEYNHVFRVLNEKYAIMKIGNRYYSLKQDFYDNLENIIQGH